MALRPNAAHRRDDAVGVVKDSEAITEPDRLGPVKPGHRQTENPEEKSSQLLIPEPTENEMQVILSRLLKCGGGHCERGIWRSTQRQVHSLSQLIALDNHDCGLNSRAVIDG